MEFKIDIHTEQAFLSQALKYEKPRELLLTHTTPYDFQIDEHKSIVWSIFELKKSGKNFDRDVILSYSKQSKIGKEVDYDFIDNLYNNFEDKEIDCLPLLEKLKRDGCYYNLIDKKVPELLKNLMSPKTKINEIESLIEEITNKIQRSKITVDTSFLNLRQLTEKHDKLDEERKKGISFYTTGLKELDKHLTYGFFPKGVTIIAGRTGMGKCLEHSSLIYDLNNNKYITIKDFCEKKVDKILSMENNKIVINKVKDWFYCGKKDCYEIETRMGYKIKCADTHPFFTMYLRKIKRKPIFDWKTLKQIKEVYKEKTVKGKLKIALTNKNKTLIENNVYSSEMMRLLGYLFADGGLTTKTLRWTKTDKDIVSDFKFCLNKEFPTIKIVEESKRKNHFKLNSGMKKNSGNPLRTFLEGIDCLKLSKNKSIPNQFYSHSNKYIKEFLKAFLSSDGHFENSVRCTLASYDLILGLQKLLLRFKIISSIHYKEAKLNSKVFDSWRLSICGYENIKRFNDEIGFVNKKNKDKINKYLLEKKDKVRNLNYMLIDDLLFDTIKEIRYIGKSDMYDLTIESKDEPCYISNNFVCHNSATITNIAKNLSNKKKHCLMFSLESDNMVAYDRILSQYTQIPLFNFTKNRKFLNQMDEKRLLYEKERLIKNPYFMIHDEPIDIKGVETQIKICQEKLQQEYFVVQIDLVGKLREFLKAGHTAESYEKYLNQIQQLSKSLGVHFVLVAQINRLVEKRKDRRPMLSDLKGSSAWEEVADLILLLHRERYYLEKYEKEEIDLDNDILEIQIAKQRQGTDKTIEFKFNRETVSIQNLKNSYIEFDEETFDSFIF